MMSVCGTLMRLAYSFSIHSGRPLHDLERLVLACCWLDNDADDGGGVSRTGLSVCAGDDVSDAFDTCTSPAAIVLSSCRQFLMTEQLYNSLFTNYFPARTRYSPDCALHRLVYDCILMLNGSLFRSFLVIILCLAQCRSHQFCTVIIQIHSNMQQADRYNPQTQPFNISQVGTSQAWA